jgi:hypothetical protein
MFITKENLHFSSRTPPSRATVVLMRELRYEIMQNWYC